MGKSRIRTVSLFMVAALLLPFAAPYVSAEERGTVITLMDIENGTYDPRYDYLEGIIWGLLLYDFSRIPGVSLVERRDLERVLDEQRLRLQGLVEDEEEAIRVGELLGADYLLHGTYVFLGEDIILTLSCTSVKDGRTSSFSDRGHTENLVHSLAEKTAERLTGTRPELVSPDGNRSIISLRDESPGTIVLHSPLVNAAIYLDGEFYGYTNGNMTEPIVIDDLPPGRHTVETRAGNDFGVIDLPRFTFRPWSVEIDLKAGKRVVVRDETRHFNDIIYRLMDITSGDLRSPDLVQSPIIELKETSFIDLEGTEHKIRISVRSESAGGTLSVICVLRYDNEEKSLTVPFTPDEETEHEIILGKVKLELDVSYRYNRFEVEYTVRRTDISQNMWR